MIKEEGHSVARGSRPPCLGRHSVINCQFSILLIISLTAYVHFSYAEALRRAAPTLAQRRARRLINAAFVIVIHAQKLISFLTESLRVK